MADNLHKLAIEIQGEVDAKFGDSIKDMQSHLKQLEEGVKSVSDGKMKPDAISKAFIRTNHAAGETAQELNKLNTQMKQVDGFIKLGKEVEDAEQKLSEARDEVERLEELQRASGTKKFADQIKAANKEATAAERAYNKQKSTLTTLDEKLKQAGVDTENLSGEQQRLAGEIEQVTAKSKDLGNQMERLARAKYHFGEIGKHVKQLGSDFKWLGKTYLKMGAVLGAGGFGLYKISDSVAAAGDAAAKSAAKLHMGTEAFQELKYAADLSGVKDFDGMMVKFNASLAKMSANTKSGPAKELNALGINVKQFAKMKPEQAIQIMADELNKIKDPAQRTRAELALFGKSGAEMGAFLKIGSSGMKELMNEARATGLVISDEAAKQAEAFNDARDKMKGTITGLKNIIGAELIPVFTDLFGELSTFFVENQDVIKDFAVNLGVKFRELLPTFKELAQGVGKFIGVMWDVGKVVTNVVGGVENFGVIIAALPLIKPAITIGKLIGSFGGLAKSLWGVKGAIGIVGKAFLTNPITLAVGAIAGAAYLIYKNWEPIKGFFSDIWDGLKEKSAAAKDFILAGWNALPGPIRGALSGVGEIVSAQFRVGYTIVKGIIGYFKGDFADLPSALKNIFAGVKDIITKPFGDAFGWVETKWASLKNWLGIAPTINADVNVAEIPNGGGGSRGNGVPHGPNGRARGGRQNTPAIIPFAERGAEVAVPLGLADRSHGIDSLNMASRGLGLGNVVNPTGMEDSLKGVPTVQNRNVRVDAKFSMPQINLAVHGGDPEEVRRTIIEVMREIGASMIPEWKEQIERAAYGTT